MSDESKPQPTPAEELAEVVRRALAEAADLQDLEERLKEISQRASKRTPPPEGPKEPEP